MQNENENENDNECRCFREIIFLVNVTEKSFFRYSKKNKTDEGYNKLLLELLTPPINVKTGKKTTISHWNRTDQIVIAPYRFHYYLERTYNELYESAFINNKFPHQQENDLNHIDL